MRRDEWDEWDRCGCAEDGVPPHPKGVSEEGRAPVLSLFCCALPFAAAKARSPSEVKLAGEWCMGEGGGGCSLFT